MYKRIISIFLALLMLLSLCACRRKDPAEISESFAGTPVVTEDPQTTPVPTTAPDNSTPSPRPTLNWVESEDGQSMTAALPGSNGGAAQVQIGVVQGEAAEDLPDDSTLSTPTDPTTAPTASAASTPVPTASAASTPAPTASPASTPAPTASPASTPAPTASPASTPAPTASPAPTTAPTVAPRPTDSPSQTQAPATNWTGPARNTTLAQYEAMSGQEQLLFYYSFASAADFNAWYNTAKEAHDAAQDYIEIGGNGVVNAGG